MQQNKPMNSHSQSVNDVRSDSLNSNEPRNGPPRKRVPWDHAIRTASHLPCADLGYEGSSTHNFHPDSGKKYPRPFSSRKKSSTYNQVYPESSTNQARSSARPYNVPYNNVPNLLPAIGVFDSIPNGPAQNLYPPYAVSQQTQEQFNQSYARFYKRYYSRCRQRAAKVAAEVATESAAEGAAEGIRVGAANSSAYCSKAAPPTNTYSPANAASASTSSSAPFPAMYGQNCAQGAGSVPNQAYNPYSPPNALPNALPNAGFPYYTFDNAKAAERLTALEHQNAQLIAYHYYLTSQLYAANASLNSMRSNGVPLTPPSVVNSPNDQSQLPLMSYVQGPVANDVPNVPHVSNAPSAPNVSNAIPRAQTTSKMPYYRVPRVYPGEVAKEGAKKPNPRKASYQPSRYQRESNESRPHVVSEPARGLLQRVPVNYLDPRGNVPPVQPLSPVDSKSPASAAVQPPRNTSSRTGQSPVIVPPAVQPLNSKANAVTRGPSEAALQEYPIGFINIVPTNATERRLQSIGKLDTKKIVETKERLKKTEFYEKSIRGIHANVFFQSSGIPRSSSKHVRPRSSGNANCLEHFPINFNGSKCDPDEVISYKRRRFSVSSDGRNCPTWNASGANFHVLRAPKPVDIRGIRRRRPDNTPQLKTSAQPAQPAQPAQQYPKPAEITPTDDEDDEDDLRIVSVVERFNRPVRPIAKSLPPHLRPMINTVVARNVRVVSANNSFVREIIQPEPKQKGKGKEECTAGTNSPDLHRLRCTVVQHCTSSEDESVCVVEEAQPQSSDCHIKCEPQAQPGAAQCAAKDAITSTTQGATSGTVQSTSGTVQSTSGTAQSTSGTSGTTPAASQPRTRIKEEESV